MSSKLALNSGDPLRARMTALAANRTLSRVAFIMAIVGGTTVVTLALMALSYGSGQSSDNSFSLAVAVHLASVIPALLLGLVVLMKRKGDRTHRLLGRIWVMLMLTTALSSFWFELSFIHVFSVVTLVTIPVSLWRAAKGDIVGHRRAMEGLYIGTVVAGAFAFIPGRFLSTLLFG